MATIVNNPPSSESNGGMGMVIGFILLLVLLALFFIYGFPMIRQSTGPQVNIPDRVDVNVNQPNQ